MNNRELFVALVFYGVGNCAVAWLNCGFPVKIVVCLSKIRLNTKCRLFFEFSSPATKCDMRFLFLC